MKFRTTQSNNRQVLITIDKFNGGSNKLIDEARMDKKFAVESVNMYQDQDGIWKTKWGSAEYGADYGATPDGAREYVKSDGSTELIVIAGGKAYSSTDGGSISEISGATFTAGLPCYFMQISGFLYIANGTDPLARYNGTTLEKYTEIDAPENLSGALTSGIASGTYTLYAEVTALNEIGETTGSVSASLAINRPRDTWTSTTDKITWSWDAVAGASRYNIYISDEDGYQEYLGSSTTNSFEDTGENTINPYIIPPETNTTSAPKFKSMCMSENRIWATNDSNSKHTVYFSGTGQFLGNFSDFYGGGWINLEKGGREMPTAVVHYQSGQGDGRPTVLCKTPDGKGAIWQLSIATATVGDVSFSIPSAVKVVGSFGTESINGVVATNNDIAFPNRRGWFSLGPEKQYFGILRTNEISSNIRPYWRNLISDKISGIAAYFYDAKIFIAVPTTDTGNDRLIIYDTERGNWSVDWTNSVKQFLDYTDSNNNTRFLYIPTSGNKLIELNENYGSDSGEPFYQSYLSPLLPISKDKTDMLSHRESILELGRPRGVIDFEIIGIGKSGSVATIGSTTITNFGSNTGVGTDLAGELMVGETNSSVRGGDGTWAIYLIDSPSTFASASTRRGIRKKTRLYAIQFKVSSTSADTSYSLLYLQARGSVIKRRMPSSWTN